MQIFNAKKNSVTIKLDNGEIISIAPGEVSKLFMGSVSVITQVLAIGQPDVLGIIISSSYEMDILRQKNASLAYVFSDVASARAKLMDGKDLTPAPTTVPIAEHEKVKKVLADITAQKEELAKAVEELEKKLEVAPSTKLLHEIDDKNKTIAELRSKIQEFDEKSNAINADINEVRAERDQLKSENSSLQAKIQELDNKLTESGNKVDALQAAVDTMPEHTVDLEALNTELEELKAKKAELESLLKTADEKVVAQDNKIKELEEQLTQAGAGATEVVDPKDTPEFKELVSDNEQLNAKISELNEMVEGSKKQLEEGDAKMVALIGENTALKSDAEKAVATIKDLTTKFESAKSMLRACMDKYNITFVDGEFKKAE